MRAVVLKGDFDVKAPLPLHVKIAGHKNYDTDIQYLRSP